MNTKKHQIFDTTPLDERSTSIDYTQNQSNWVVIACLSFFPLIYLIGRWVIG